MFVEKLSVGLCSLALVSAMAAPAGVAADWPQFRGPDRDGVSSETGLAKGWPEAGPEQLWRTQLGEGFSALSVAGGHLFTMFARGEDEFVVSIDASNGQELWRVRADSKWVDDQGNGPRSTPTVHGGLVYALSASGKLHALDAADGKVRWSHDLQKEYGASIPRWGMSTSPLIEGGRLVVEAGGKPGALLMAFDPKTGEELWRSQSGKAGYSAPLAVTVNGLRQVLSFAGTTLLSVSPSDGSLYWKLPWQTDWDVNAAMPVFVPPDKIFISSGYDVGSALLKIEAAEGRASVSEVWKSREMKNQFSSSVLHRGHLYGFDDKTLKAIDARTGETRWRAPRNMGHGSLIYADGHLVVLSETGELVLVEATPEEYREKGRARIFQGKSWTMPTLSGGRLYLRNERELVALKVSG